MCARFRVVLGVLIAGIVGTVTAAGFERPLSSESVREAYFLGQQNDEHTRAFLARYLQRPPMPKTGPHVAEIEISTPYRLVVLRARRAVAGSSAQRAEQDYRARPNLFLVRVRINLTPTYPDFTGSPAEPGGVRFRAEDFWRDFSIRLIQDRAVSPRRVSGTPIYSSAFGRGFELIGAEVELEYDARQIASAPARIEVLTPDGQRVTTEFDLSKFR